MKDPLYIHVGIRKTATTFMQQTVFSDVDGLNCMHRHKGKSEFSNDFFIYLDNEYSEYDPEIAQDLFNNSIEAFFQNDMVNIISDEGISTTSAYSERCDRGMKAERLKGFGRPIKIILVIRNQLDLAKSLYSDFIKDAHRDLCRTAELNEWASYNIRWIRSGGIFGLLRFGELVNCYETLFSRENVLVVPYEYMKKDPDKYVQMLGEFMGLSPQKLKEAMERPLAPQQNLRLKRSEWIGIWLVNNIFNGFDFRQNIPKPVKRFLQFFLDRRKKDFEFDPKIACEIEDAVREGNKKIAKDYDLPLGELGYPV